MRTFAALLALLVQQPSPSPAPGTEEPAPWAGRLSEGVEALRRFSLEGDRERARETARALAARLDAQAAREVEEARVRFAIGVASARAGEIEPAVGSFRRAHALAGPGGLRLDSGYNAGTHLLLRAEELRAALKQAAPLQGAPPVSAPAPGAPPQEGDALERALAAYAEARAALVHRLREDASHAATRANLELAQKRIRELEELRRQREEEKRKEQEQQQEGQEEEPGEQEGQEPKPRPEDSEQGSEPEKDREGADPREQEPSQTPEGEGEAGDEEPEQKEGEEKEPSEPQQEGGGEAQEGPLTRAQLQRLIDQLQEIDQQARALQAQIRKLRRTPVERDW